MITKKQDKQMIIKKQYFTPDRLIEMVKNIQMMDKCIKTDRIISISEIGWVYPMSILPIAVHANNNDVIIYYSGDNPDIDSYLNTICFPDGITSLSDINSNYIPITKISCDLENPMLNDYEERILSNVSEKYRSSFINGLKFLTSELQNNVEEHADIGHYWIFAQYWEKTKTCEICIVDTGIGYKESYKGTKYEVDNHFDAIRNAIKGLSCKPIKERGCGVSGIMRMFIEGYKGELMIMSGNGLFYVNKKKQIMYKSPVPWNGAIIGLKFTLKNIDVSKYY